MKSALPTLRLTLRFATKPRLELRATEFQMSSMTEGQIALKCTEGKSGDGFFAWGEGPQALCLCLIRYLCSRPDMIANGMKFVFVGDKGSPAKTADNVLAKANNANCWQINIFGHDANGSCRLKRFIKRKNPDGKKPNRGFELEVQHEEFPQSAVVIEVDGQNITDTAALMKLGDDIEDQWYDRNPSHKTQWAKVKKARQQRPNPSTEAAHRASAAPNDNKKANTTSSTPWVSDQFKSRHADELRKSVSKFLLPDHLTVLSLNPSSLPLVDLFSQLTSPQIKEYILSQLSSLLGQDAYENFLDELSSPECIEVIAGKLLEDTIENFVDFYASEYDSPPSFKRKLAECITNDPERLQLMTAKVARSGNRDMNHWFEKCAPSFSNGILISVEEALVNEINGDPHFKQKFSRCSLRDLCALISYFKEYGRDYFTHYLTELCFEEDMRRIKEAYAANPKVLERFVATIGQEQFRSCIKRLVSPEQSAGFKVVIDLLLPKKRIK